MDWQKLEYYMFIHFGPNTFTHVEWGDGQEDPNVFYPTDLDCRQWARTARDAGMTGIILTAKHHDGFCLWPSEYSTHTVRETKWRDGMGDVVRELEEACREYGLLFGIYISPWDQNHPAYGTAEYNEVFANTMTEVLTNYGDVFTMWLDGARPRHVEHDYDWPMFFETATRAQPNIIIFSDIGPGCRWVGNERGVAGETNWSTINTEGYTPGWGAPSVRELNEGEQGGASWIPGEVNVSIRPGWFYTPRTTDRVKTVEHLMDIWHTSVGRNGNLLLNVPPDTRGRIHEVDSTRLMEFRRAREEAFTVNLAEGATANASHTRGRRFAATNVLNDDYHSYWTTKDNVLNPYLEITLRQPQTFNRLALQEYIPLGQRVYAFNVEYWNEGTNAWTDLAEATTIGFRRILRFPAVTTQKLRIHFNAMACPIINGFRLYFDPERYLAAADE
jgi:alpha-L-fucosidase